MRVAEGQDEDPGRNRRTELDRLARLVISDPVRAEIEAGSFLIRRPDDPDIALLLGVALRNQGDNASASRILEPLAVSQPGSWLVQAELGQAWLALGRSRDALGAILKAVTLNQDYLLGWRLLADIRRFARDLRAAQAAEDQYLRALLGDSLRAPTEAMVRGSLAEAESILLAQLRTYPHDTAIAHLLAEVFLRQQRLGEATRLLSACALNDPGYTPASIVYADVLRRTRQFAPALDRVDAQLQVAPDSFRLRLMKSEILAELGDFMGAAEITAGLLGEVPDQAQAWVAYGQQLQILGRFDEAVAALRRSLELDQRSAKAYGGLAALKTYRFSPQDEAAMEAVCGMAEVSDEDRGVLHFAIARAKEERGLYAQAFEHFDRGNRLVGSARPHDPTFLKGLIAELRAMFTPEFFDVRAGWGVNAPDPIFIVGLPRSGSTLVEQVLGSHPAIEATRELSEIGMIADALSGEDSRRYPSALRHATRDVLSRLGRSYLQATRPYRRLGRARFSDKQPANFIHVGLIHLMLPRAKIIDVRRHPLGCCLSAYKENFAEGWGATYDLVSMGQYYVAYVELMAHYDAVLPGRIHRVFYEELVLDTETQVRRLLEYLELSFDARCLRFFETSRAVATASSGQVRRPIYDHAIDEWRRFEAWLDPLKAALGPALRTYPSRN